MLARLRGCVSAMHILRQLFNMSLLGVFFKFAIGIVNNDILIAVTVRIRGKMCVRVCREYT